MNNKGQAALEYLMTYGWALVIIVVVAAILFLLVSSPSSTVSCSSTDPKLTVQASDVNKASGQVRLLNGTGGQITSIVVAKGGSFNVSPGGSAPSSLSSGAVGVVGLSYTSANTLDANTSFTMQYTDQFNYPKVATISCSGSPQK